MRHRVGMRHRHRADIYEWVDDPDGGQELEPVDTDVKCAFDPESTEFIREDTGEHVRRPAEVRFMSDIDVSEGMIVEIYTISGAEFDVEFNVEMGDRIGGQYEITGIEPARDTLRWNVVFKYCELQRFD